MQRSLGYIYKGRVIEIKKNFRVLLCTITAPITNNKIPMQIRACLNYTHARQYFNDYIGNERGVR